MQGTRWSKNKFFCSALVITLGLGSCAPPCYNARFCQDMLGKSEPELRALLGNPSSIQHAHGSTLYSWKAEKEFTVRKFIPSDAPSWNDDGQHRLSAQNRAELIVHRERKTAEISFIIRDGRVASYFNQADEEMCNALIPASIIQQYQQQ